MFKPFLVKIGLYLNEKCMCHLQKDEILLSSLRYNYHLRILKIEEHQERFLEGLHK